ncbi:MAG TPA: DUF1810 domain-containing protein [Puia sp.]|jgi:uncharacterized protein (DUF1810 family)|nr:DUF1810 domain-containing protein [Puia sp.]
MAGSTSLKRFLDAQEQDYPVALAEIKAGRKRSHWMWYIFPQIQGLGFSTTSRYYAIKDLAEAQQYLADPVLGIRLIEISQELMKLGSDNATTIFGSPDDLKLKSCMTLFASLAHTVPVFDGVLKKFFKGEKDLQTLKIIKPGP